MQEKLLAVWQAWRVEAVALLIFLSSRFLMFVAAWFGARYLPGQEAWTANTWCKYLLRWDAGWFLKIAETGYSYDGNILNQQSVVFFPLYPLAGRWAGAWLHVGAANGLILVSTLAGLLGLVLWARVVKEEYGAETAYGAIAALCYFPTSLFLSVVYTEALAFFFIAGFFLALRRGHLWLAALCSGLATGTRVVCLVLVLPLVWELWERYRQDIKRLLGLGLAYVVIATAGLWGYILFLWRAFGKPFAFYENMLAWQPDNPNTLLKALWFKTWTWNLPRLWREGAQPDTIDPWLWLFFLGLLVWQRKRLKTSWWLFGAGAVVLPYLSRSGGALGFTSMLRYLLLALPVFVILGQMGRERPRLAWVWLATGAGLLFMYTALFTQWHWAG